MQHVIDPTQTAFVPGRWIGDNVLSHLEEVEYLQQTGQSGCMVVLDFSKAYDRLDRQWVSRCMASMGFGQRACKWVSIMLHCTTATAAFNGWQSASFPEASGVQQGSPLSPLLYVIAAQPLASHLRLQAQLGVLRPILMPDGQPAPVSHQHADDTTLHVLQPADAQLALNGSVALFCSATGSQLNVSKSRGFLVQAQPLASPAVAALPGISFLTGQQTVKHLGVRWGMTCPQLVSKPSLPFTMRSRQRSLTGQLVACPSWAGCILLSKCWQPHYGTMPHSSHPQHSFSARSAGSFAASWQRPANSSTQMLLSLWPMAALIALNSCKACLEGLPCSQASSSAHCPPPKGVWGWCMSQLRCRLYKPR